MRKKQLMPKDLLHELEQGGSIEEDMKEFFRREEHSRPFDYHNLVSGFGTTIAHNSFMPRSVIFDVD